MTFPSSGPLAVGARRTGLARGGIVVDVVDDVDVVVRFTGDPVGSDVDPKRTERVVGAG